MFGETVINSRRKDQHVALANQQFTTESARDFAQTRFVHQSLPEMKVEDVQLQTSVAGLTMEVPFFINAMTGGSEQTHSINQLIGIVAHLTKLPVASGSVSAALKDSSLADSFRILRDENPHGILFANLGAHHSLDNAKRAVDLLEADGLQLHLNAPQELIMREGDRDFSMWLKNIEEIVSGLEVPVIVKEVGFGMSRETVARLASVGVQTVDISGTGGTDFAWIENMRRGGDSYPLLNGWGQSTVISLLEAMSLDPVHRPAVIASGGIKNELDIVKSLALGADLVGISNRILQLVQNRQLIDKAIYEIGLLKERVAEMMLLLGANNIAELRQKDVIVAPDVQSWCEARQIDWKHYANRSMKQL